MFHWYIDPWNLILPHTMAFADTLSFNVKISVPVSFLPGEFVMDTLDILTENGLKQLFIKVDSDLLSGIVDPGLVVGADFESIRPNPFRDEVTLVFGLKKETRVELSVFGLDGRQIAILADRTMTSGRHEVRWNPKENGQQLPAGIYIVRLQTGQGTISRKLAISR
jgi:hypothetical protein